MDMSLAFLALMLSSVVAALGIWVVALIDRRMDRKAAEALEKAYAADAERHEDCPGCGARWQGYRSQYRIHTEDCALKAVLRGQERLLAGDCPSSRGSTPLSKQRLAGSPLPMPCTPLRVGSTPAARIATTVVGHTSTAAPTRAKAAEMKSDEQLREDARKGFLEAERLLNEGRFLESLAVADLATSRLNASLLRSYCWPTPL